MKSKSHMYTPRSLLVRCLTILVGVGIMGFGASCYITANLGSDPVTAFTQGVANVTGLSLGMAINVVNVTALVILLFLDRKLIHIATVLYTLSLGVFCDLFIALLALIHQPSLALRIVFVVVGTVAIGFGLGLYQAANLGAGPTDGINQAVAAKTKIPLRWERIGFDIVMVIGGFLMGGVVSWGTLVGMFGVGPIMAPTFTRLSPVVDKWSGTPATPAEGDAI